MDYLKHLLVRTPLETPALAVKSVLMWPKLVRHPELRPVFAEAAAVRDVFRKVLAPTSNCVDIGCHVGSVLSRITQLAPRGTHSAFEPLPRKAAWLRRKFPEVHVFDIALSDRSGLTTFFHNRTRTGYSGLMPHLEPGDAIDRLTIRTEKLDDVVESDHRIHVLKVDVEGAELLVLRGAVGTLARCRPTVVFESTLDGLAAHELSPAALFDFFVANDYEVHLPSGFLAGGEALVVEEFEKAHRYPFGAFDFVAAPRRRFPSAGHRAHDFRGSA